jgi:hypothetical protein
MAVVLVMLQDASQMLPQDSRDYKTRRINMIT